MRISEEHIPLAASSFRLLRTVRDAFDHPRHRHGALELIWIEAGHGIRQVGNAIHPFEPGDLVLVGARVPHLWRTSATRPGAVSTVFQFPEELLRTLPELGALDALVTRAQAGLAVGEPAHGRVVALMQVAQSRNGLGQLASLLEILHVLNECPEALAPLSDAPVRTTRGGRSIDPLLDWIDRHLAEPLSVEQAAAVAHVAPAAFSRHFKRKAGRGFTAYVQQARCAEACRHLLDGDRPIGHVAELCGFTSVSQFNRVFRGLMEMTPRDYRRRMRDR